MVEPLSVVTTILTVVQLIGCAALRARQNKKKCRELADRVNDLGHVLRNFEYPDTGTARVLGRLNGTLGEALKLVESCDSLLFSGNKAAELDRVDKQINNCIMDLSLIGQARANSVTAQASGSAPAQTYYQAQGGAASSLNVASSPQHAWSASSQGYYQPPGGYVQWVPCPPSPYTASPAPSGANLSTFYTLPTVNKIFDRVFR